MEHLRDSVRLRAYGQKDPLLEYKNEGRKMFEELLHKIDELIANSIFRVQIVGHEHTHTQNRRFTHSSSSTSSAVAASNTSAGQKQEHVKKIGRNDACPCGSGKKWKRCGMIGVPEHKK